MRIPSNIISEINDRTCVNLTKCQDISISQLPSIVKQVVLTATYMTFYCTIQKVIISLFCKDHYCFGLTYLGSFKITSNAKAFYILCHLLFHFEIQGKRYQMTVMLNWKINVHLSAKCACAARSRFLKINIYCKLY